MTDHIQAEPPRPDRPEELNLRKPHGGTPGWVWVLVLIPVLGFLVCAGMIAVFVALLTFSPTSPGVGPDAVPVVRPANR